MSYGVSELLDQQLNHVRTMLIDLKYQKKALEKLPDNFDLTPYQQQKLTTLLEQLTLLFPPDAG